MVCTDVCFVYRKSSRQEEDSPLVVGAFQDLKQPNTTNRGSLMQVSFEVIK
jgi:hypothetical protein